MVSKLKDVKISDYDVIAIDEAQFFSDLFENVLTFVERYKKTVIVAGLSGDYKRGEFGQILKLIPFCDLDQLRTTTAYCCMCNNGKSASFTKRISDEKDQILVGDKDHYKAVCRDCFLRV
jgi:thymidine kinase